ncbi:MAG: EAL domain-containing protein [Candidatus Limnocylindrales bacterium]
MRGSGPEAGRHGNPRAPRRRTPIQGPSPRAQDPALSHEAAVPTLSGHITARFREVTNAAPVAAFVKDRDGRYIYANPHLLATVGERMGSDWYGKTDADVWPPDVAALVRANDEATFRGDGLQVFSQVIPLQDGPHTFLVMESPLSTGGPSIGLVGIGVDVTQPSRTEAGRDRLTAAEARPGRDRISGTIARRAFHPVFQPIVDLGSKAIVGYEALTRFDDGADPQVVFAEAAALDLGLELETATLQAALAAAEALPRSAWLNLNASPELIMAGEPLRTILGGRRRRLVLEVTEHAAIVDYPAFRAAMAALGPRVELAVDDAGALFTSLRNILELRPAFVKLDRSLVTGLESDYARHAMIAGLRHFARATGFRLIAEGIETDPELAILRALDVQLGQGFLLGRPLPVDSA